MWAELLQTATDGLSLASDFFSLGGNSLLVARLINLLKQRTGAELPVQAVFDAPRLADLAAELERRVPATEVPRPTELDLIRQGVSLIEQMSDEELDSIEIQVNR